MGERAIKKVGLTESLVELLKHDGSGVRGNALIALSMVAKTAAEAAGVVESLIGLLKDGDRGVRWYTAIALSKMGEKVLQRPDILEALVELLGKEDDTTVRDSLVYALSLIPCLISSR